MKFAELHEVLLWLWAASEPWWRLTDVEFWQTQLNLQEFGVSCTGIWLAGFVKFERFLQAHWKVPPTPPVASSQHEVASTTWWRSVRSSNRSVMVMAIWAFPHPTLLSQFIFFLRGPHVQWFNWTVFFLASGTYSLNNFRKSSCKVGWIWGPTSPETSAPSICRGTSASKNWSDREAPGSPRPFSRGVSSSGARPHWKSSQCLADGESWRKCTSAMVKLVEDHTISWLFQLNMVNSSDLKDNWDKAFTMNKLDVIFPKISGGWWIWSQNPPGIPKKTLQTPPLAQVLMHKLGATEEFPTHQAAILGIVHLPLWGQKIWVLL